MPNGFVGASAKQYLSQAEQVLNAAIDTHNGNAHGVSVTNERLPHAPDTALKGSGTGGGGSENIVAHYETYINAMRLADIGQQASGNAVHKALSYTQEMCTTDFILPAVTPRVQAFAEELITALNDSGNARHEFMSLVRSYGNAMTNEPVGHNIDMVWNQSAADGIRNETERALRAQVPHMQTTISAHDREIGRMMNALPELGFIANNAMTTTERSETRYDEDGYSYTHTWEESIPDYTRRQAARDQMAHYQQQIPVLRSAIRNLRNGIDDLQTALPTLRNRFISLQENLQAADRAFADQIRRAAENLAAVNRRVQAIMDRITTDFGMAGGGVRGIAPYAEPVVLADGQLFKYDEDGNLVFDWEKIAKILDKPYEDMTDEDIWALTVAMIMAGSQGLESLERFIRYIPDKVDSDELDFLVVWEVCPDKIDAIYNSLEMFLHVEYPGSATIMQYRALLYSLRDIAAPMLTIGEAREWNNIIHIIIHTLFTV